MYWTPGGVADAPSRMRTSCTGPASTHTHVSLLLLNASTRKVTIGKLPPPTDPDSIGWAVGIVLPASLVHACGWVPVPGLPGSAAVGYVTTSLPPVSRPSPSTRTQTHSVLGSGWKMRMCPYRSP